VLNVALKLSELRREKLKGRCEMGEVKLRLSRGRFRRVSKGFAKTDHYTVNEDKREEGKQTTIYTQRGTKWNRIEVGREKRRKNDELNSFGV